MKVVVNKCYGGFSLSPAAVRRLAELNGRECYFFTNQAPDGSRDFNKHFPAEESELNGSLFWSAFDVPNPDEVIGPSFRDADGLYKTYNARHGEHDLTNRPDDRADPKLVQVVEELGGEHRKGASGYCSELKIVEIPDGVQYEIDEYDGMEHIAEVHRTWG